MKDRPQQFWCEECDNHIKGLPQREGWPVNPTTPPDSAWKKCPGLHYSMTCDCGMTLAVRHERMEEIARINNSK